MGEEKNRIERVHKTHRFLEKHFFFFSVCSSVDSVYFHCFVLNC